MSPPFCNSCSSRNQFFVKSSLPIFGHLYSMDTLVSTPITLVCVAAYLPGRTILRVSSSSRRLRAAFSNEAAATLSLALDAGGLRGAYLLRSALTFAHHAAKGRTQLEATLQNERHAACGHFKAVCGLGDVFEDAARRRMMVEATQGNLTMELTNVWQLLTKRKEMKDPTRVYGRYGIMADVTMAGIADHAIDYLRPDDLVGCFPLGRRIIHFIRKRRPRGGAEDTVGAALMEGGEELEDEGGVGGGGGSSASLSLREDPFYDASDLFSTVVRGPDWTEGNQDGGEGSVGYLVGFLDGAGDEVGRYVWKRGRGGECQPVCAEDEAEREEREERERLVIDLNL